jgi:hypothetical protein
VSRDPYGRFSKCTYSLIREGDAAILLSMLQASRLSGIPSVPRPKADGPPPMPSWMRIFLSLSLALRHINTYVSTSAFLRDAFSHVHVTGRSIVNSSIRPSINFHGSRKGLAKAKGVGARGGLRNQAQAADIDCSQAHCGFRCV